MNTKTTLALALTTLLATSQAAANDDKRIAIGGGIFGAFDTHQISTIKLGVEFAPNENYWGIRPQTQVLATDKGAYYLSVGGVRDFAINNDWSWGLAFSAGYYHEDNSDSTDKLGHHIEFYSAISASYHIDKQSFIRTELGHISNGSLGDKNPGSESVIVSYVVNF